ncbi:uncharacterized protein LOC106081507 [Stomoxys calcitrans]|uniref:DUF3421 domain-containing protein n=1 Tax=Stomoxys calcitrans TaxID=35570 RepID=A0A1I8PKX5_STOCA|nr:uncharacterized protein LOC106081507 [Stomoxys calcitrans]
MEILDVWAPLTAPRPMSRFAVKLDSSEATETSYVGRCSHDGNKLPATIIPSRGCAIVYWNNLAHVKFDYEFLVGPGYCWTPVSNGTLPTNAVSAGQTKEDGELLYIAKAKHKDKTLLGAVRANQQRFSLWHEDNQIEWDNYEILTRACSDLWLPTDVENLPTGAVLAGHDNDGFATYVARAMHKGIMSPAKFLPQKRAAFIASDGQEVLKTEIEVLVGSNYMWQKPQKKDEVPSNAVFAGRARDGQPLCVGRTYLRGNDIPGLISFERQCIIVPYQGRGLSIISYELLVKQGADGL